MLEIIGSIGHVFIRLQSLMPHVTILGDEGFDAFATQVCGHDGCVSFTMRRLSGRCSIGRTRHLHGSPYHLS